MIGSGVFYFFSSEIVAVGDGAIRGLDFIFNPTTVYFEHGNMKKTVTISIVDDDEIEPTEDIKCLLSNARGTVIGIPHETRILIEDNELTLDTDQGKAQWLRC